MKYEKLNKQIIELVGGKENIAAAAHCVTRLRLTLKNRDIANSEEIKKLDGVIDVVSNDVAYQIIIGTQVTEVYTEFMAMAGLNSGDADGTGDGAAKKEKLHWKQIPTAILSVISESMTSIIEVLLAAGMVGGVLSLLSLAGIVSPESSTYQIFETLRTSVFTFLPVFLAASSAKRLNVNQYVAIMLATTVMSDNINGAENLDLFGYHLPTIEYSNTFIPILLGVWLLKVVSELFKKIIPQALQLFLIPVISLMITLPVMLIFFGPIGMWIGEGISWFFDLLATNIGYWIAIALYAAFQPFLIVFGAANFLFPISVNFFAELGYDPILTAAATISDIAVCGAMFGYFLKAKDPKEKSVFGPISFSALMGVTEPAIFGVFLKYRRPFLAVIVGGGIGGLIAGFTGVKAWTMAWGLAGLPAFLMGGNWNFIWMIISCAVAFVLAAIVAYGVGIPETKKETAASADTAVPAGQPIRQIALEKVIAGDVVDLNSVSDKAFASGALGKGIALVPEEKNGDLYAPAAGEVTVVFPTKHAYGLKTAEGAEILIHVGIDTVNLEGEGFTSHVQVGDHVETGDLLATIDFDLIQSKGFDPTVMVVITNTADFLDVVSVKNEENEKQMLAIIM